MRHFEFIPFWGHGLMLGAAVVVARDEAYLAVGFVLGAVMVGRFRSYG